MSLSTIAYDGGGFDQWRSQRDFRADPPNSWQANGAGSQATGTPAAATASGTAASPLTPAAWLSSTEGAASTLISDLQAFLVDLQAGGTAAAPPAPASATAPDPNAGATAAAAAVAATAAAATGASATAGTATTGQTTTGQTTTGPARTGPATTGPATAAAVAPTTAGGDAANLVDALQSFIALLDGGTTGQSAAAGTTTPATPSPQPADGWQGHGGGWRHHGGGWGGGGGNGSGGVFGELQTTNELLGQILGALGGYTAQGNPATTPAAATSVSA